MTEADSCTRCGKDLERKLSENANYVTNSDLAVEEKRERWVAVRHTAESREKLDALDSELPYRTETIEDSMADAGVDVETYNHRDVEQVSNIGEIDEIPDEDAPVFMKDIVSEDKYNDVPLDKVETSTTGKSESVDFGELRDLFEITDIDNPERAKTQDNVVRVEQEFVDVSVQKTAVVCESCTKPDDTIIWGVDG